MKSVALINRAVLQLRGKEVFPFLQGLLSVDLYNFDKSKCLYSFLLNAKGRIVSDLHLYRQSDEDFLLEADQNKMDDLERLLKMYRLRKHIHIIRSPTKVNFIFPGSQDVEGAVDDPRIGGLLGKRYLGELSDNVQALDVEHYVKRRLELGLGEGTYELFDHIPLNVNGDILQAVSFDKGCYIGQELIARTHHTGIIRKRLMPFKTEGMPKDGSHILDLDGKRRGKVVKALDGIGIGLISLEAVGTNVPLVSDKQVPMEFYRPDWWPASVKLGPPEIPHAS